MITQQFLEQPHLPTSAVKCVVMSDYMPNLIGRLKTYSINAVVPNRIRCISGSESYHADMSFCHIFKNVFCLEKNISQNIKSFLLQYGAKIIMTDKSVSTEKPCLNICILGNNVICNTKTVDKNLIDMLTLANFNILHTNQKYTKCSIAVINKNAVITADESIYKLCMSNNIDVLKISVGNIKLDGYKYGFIGGTCGFISKDILAFSGNIELHPDYKNIKAFAQNYNVNLLSLSDDILYDIGGILPVLESAKKS